MFRDQQDEVQEKDHQTSEKQIECMAAYGSHLSPQSPVFTTKQQCNINLSVYRILNEASIRLHQASFQLHQADQNAYSLHDANQTLRQ